MDEPVKIVKPFYKKKGFRIGLAFMMSALVVGIIIIPHFANHEKKNEIKEQEYVVEADEYTIKSENKSIGYIYGKLIQININNDSKSIKLTSGDTFSILNSEFHSQVGDIVKILHKHEYDKCSVTSILLNNGTKYSGNIANDILDSPENYGLEWSILVNAEKGGTKLDVNLPSTIIYNHCTPDKDFYEVLK